MPLALTRRHGVAPASATDALCEEIALLETCKAARLPPPLWPPRPLPPASPSPTRHCPRPRRPMCGFAGHTWSFATVALSKCSTRTPRPRAAAQPATRLALSATRSYSVCTSSRSPATMWARQRQGAAPTYCTAWTCALAASWVAPQAGSCCMWCSLPRVGACPLPWQALSRRSASWRGTPRYPTCYVGR